MNYTKYDLDLILAIFSYTIKDTYAPMLSIMKWINWSLLPLINFPWNLSGDPLNLQ